MPLDLQKECHTEVRTDLVAEKSWFCPGSDKLWSSGPNQPALFVYKSSSAFVLQWWKSRDETENINYRTFQKLTDPIVVYAGIRPASLERNLSLLRVLGKN